MTATPDSTALRSWASYSKVAGGFLKIPCERGFPQLKQQLKHKIKAKPAQIPTPVVETRSAGYSHESVHRVFLARLSVRAERQAVRASVL